MIKLTQATSGAWTLISSNYSGTCMSLDVLLEAANINVECITISSLPIDKAANQPHFVKLTDARVRIA